MTVIEVNNIDVLQSLVGVADENLKLIAQETGVTFSRNEKGIVIRGDGPGLELATDLLTQLRGLLERGEQIFSGDVERAIKMLSANKKLRLNDFFRDQLTISGRKHSIIPKTETQRLYIESIRNNDLVFGVGPAGTGKTYLAMAYAVSALLKKEYKKIILCRPAVEAGEKLGFLPGDMNEKVDPYLRPLYDALHDMVDLEKSTDFIQRGKIEVAPLAFMRGRTLSDAFVILDEAQNTTTAQMKMFLTRIGYGSKCVITGDVTQVDLPRGMKSGLVDALEILDKVKGIQIIDFKVGDVIRSDLVGRIVAAYEKYENV